MLKEVPGFLLCPPRSGSNVLQHVLSCLLEGTRHIATYNNEFTDPRQVVTVKSHAPSYVELLGELAGQTPQITYPSTIVILFRDPRLAAISAFEYSFRSQGTSFKDFLYAERYQLPGIAAKCRSYISYYQTFVANWVHRSSRRPPLFLRFEEILHSPGLINKVIQFLGRQPVATTTQHYRKLLSNASDIMQDRWEAVSVDTKSMPAEACFPIKQYAAEFGRLEDYQELADEVSLALAHEIEVLGYEAEKPGKFFPVCLSTL